MRFFRTPPFFSNVTLGFVVGVFLSIAVLPQFFQQKSKVDVSPVDQFLTSGGTDVFAEVMSSSTPVQLRIPALQIDVPFSTSLGIDSDGAIEVPESYDTVGWYRFGPTPGALGPAVVLGHIDSHKGPAVFFYLGQLKADDDIFIDREDGTTAHFKVTLLQRNKQSDFPTHAVYGDIDHAGLRLITCAGKYERGSKQRYTHNLIVYATLVYE